MSKIAIICDTHFGARGDSIIFHEYFKRSLDDFFKVLDEENIKHVIHLGDLYDRRRYVNFMTSNRCRKDFLEPLEYRGIQTHIIAGNHDHYHKNHHEINSLRELVSGKYSNILVYTVPHKLTIDGLEIQLIPWITDSNRDISINAIENTTAEILMGHLELNGFEIHRGSVMEHGMETNIFDKFDLVFSGHFHHKSTIGNIHYLGAFAEMTWADYNDPRGFHLFDTKTRELQFIRNNNHIFKMLSYDDVKNPNIVSEIQSTDYSYLANTYVRIISVNRNNPYAFDMMFDKIYQENPIDISIVEDISSFVENDENVEIAQAEDTKTILQKYISGLTLPVDSDKMKNFMLNIYHEAIALEEMS